MKKITENVLYLIKSFFFFVKDYKKGISMVERRLNQVMK